MTTHMPIAPGSQLDLRSKRYAQLERAAILAWLDALSFTQDALANAIAKVENVAVESVKASLTHYLKQLEARGQYVSQPAKFGAKGLSKQPGRPTSPHVFNFGGVDPEKATLALAVEPYLLDPIILETRKRALRSALRYHLSLPEQCPDGMIVEACERVPASRLYGYRKQVKAGALEAQRPLALRTAKNHAGAVRHCLKHAAEARLLPLVFPSFVEQDAWAAGLEQYFPLPEKGRAPPALLARRRGWYVFAEQARETLGPEAGVETMTRPEADRVIRAIKGGTRGKVAVAGTVRTMLRALAAEHGVGPFAQATAAAQFVVASAGGKSRGVRSSLMLRMPDGSDAPGWEGLLAACRANGLPEETVAFLSWCGIYLTMSAEELLGRQEEFPPRRKGHRLQAGTLNAVRAQALRAWIGAALYELRLDPGTLTPPVLFGSVGKRITGALRGWWMRRRTALGAGAIGTGLGGTLPRYLIQASMTSYTLYERLKHLDGGRTVTTKVSRSGKSDRVDRRAEEGTGKTTVQQAVWDCYEHAANTAQSLQEVAAEKLGVRTTEDYVPEFKSIREILQHTPPEYWTALLDGVITRFREMKRQGNDTTLAYHRVVQFAWELGCFISTGLRNEEGCLLRADIHPTARDGGALREKRLTGLDRKNGSETTVTIHPEYVPDDLHREYLDRTLPFFTTENHLARGRSPVPPHPFLMVNERGLPYGVRLEQVAEQVERLRARLDRSLAQAPSGDEVARTRLLDLHDRLRLRIEARAAAELRTRANQHGQRFVRGLYHWAAEFKMPIPEGLYEFSLHPLRGSCAYAIFLEEGEGASAAYLGDTVATARKAYAAIDGINVDSRVLRAAARSAQQEHLRRAKQDAPPSGTAAAAPAKRVPSAATAVAIAGDLESYAAIMTQLTAKGLTGEALKVSAEVMMAQCGVSVIDGSGSPAMPAVPGADGRPAKLGRSHLRKVS